MSDRCLETFLADPAGSSWTWTSHPPMLSKDLAETLRKRATVLSTIPAIKADAAWRWYWQAEEHWNIEDDPDQFGRLRLPFPVMVVEGRTPKRIWTSDEGWTRAAPLSFAVVLEERPGRDWDGDWDGHIIRAEVMASHAGRVVLSPSETYISIDDEGRLTPFPASVLPASTPNRYLFHTIPENEHPQISEFLLGAIRPALLAVALIHCKNTSLTVESVSPKVLRKRAKSGKPTVEWRTINVPGPAAPKTRRLQKDQAGGLVPLHIVRGHFKTYTQEAPLFGSLTGTYWWSSFARGDVSAGERLHEYEVRPGRHEAT